MSVSLAVKYRPTDLSDVVGQEETRTILTNQLQKHDLRNAYLFCGPAGCGKTTTARIFANMINQNTGGILELDAASNNSVEDVRSISQQAGTQSLTSEYNIFLLDEVQAFSSSAWGAMLKTLEEPPAKAIFIMCTTNPEKIPKTIKSRVQRFDFQRISQEGIVARLRYILQQEDNGTETMYPNARATVDQIYLSRALEYIAKLADGGMRDAITMLDKCLAYSTELTVDTVLKALGIADYDVMFELLSALHTKNAETVMKIIDQIYAQGKDLKLFIKTFMDFILDMCKYNVTRSSDFVKIPPSYKLEEYSYDVYAYCTRLLDCLISLIEQLRWETAPKSVIESTLMLQCFRED